MSDLTLKILLTILGIIHIIAFIFFTKIVGGGSRALRNPCLIFFACRARNLLPVYFGWYYVSSAMVVLSSLLYEIPIVISGIIFICSIIIAATFMRLMKVPMIQERKHDKALIAINILMPICLLISGYLLLFLLYRAAAGILLYLSSSKYNEVYSISKTNGRADSKMQGIMNVIPYAVCCLYYIFNVWGLFTNIYTLFW